MSDGAIELPTPGILGVTIRLALAAAVGFMAYGTVVDAPAFWDGYDEPLGSLLTVVPLALFSGWVVNEFFQRAWSWRPTVVLLTGAAGSVVVGSMLGDPFGPAYGIYVWLWALAFAFLLAPAFLLAAALRTPGCEMRSYAHLWTRLRGGDVAMVACPGWIDRFDRVRIFGRW